MSSIENLRFDKEDYFHVLIFYTGYSIKEIENISPPVPIRHRNTRGSSGELEITCFNFSFSQTSTRVSIIVWKHGKCFYFLNVIEYRYLAGLGILGIPVSSRPGYLAGYICIPTISNVYRNQSLDKNSL